MNFLETLPLEPALDNLKDRVVIPVALRIITRRKYLGNRDFSSLLQGEDEQLLMKTDNSKETDDVYWSLRQPQPMYHLNSCQLLFKCRFLEFVFYVLRDVFISKFSVLRFPYQVFEYVIDPVLVDGFCDLVADYSLWGCLLLISVTALRWSVIEYIAVALAAAARVSVVTFAFSNLAHRLAPPPFCMPASDHLVKRDISSNDFQNDFLLFMNRISICNQPLLFSFVVYVKHAFQYQLLDGTFLLIGRIANFHSNVHNPVLF